MTHSLCSLCFVNPFPLVLFLLCGDFCASLCLNLLFFVVSLNLVFSSVGLILVTCVYLRCLELNMVSCWDSAVAFFTLSPRSALCLNWPCFVLQSVISISLDSLACCLLVGPAKWGLLQSLKDSRKVWLFDSSSSALCLSPWFWSGRVCLPIVRTTGGTFSFVVTALPGI